MNGEPLASADWRQRKQALEALRNASPADLPAKLLAIIRENHRNLGALNAALQLLGSMREDVLPGLVSLLADPDPEVRAYALIALAEQRAPQTIPALIRAVSDPDPNVRFNAVEALGNLQAIDAIAPLTEILRQRDFYLGFAALDALVKIGAEMAVDEISDLLADEILAPAAVEALGKLGNLSTIPLLLGWLDTAAGEVGPVVSGLVALQRRLAAYQAGPTLAPLAVAENISAAGRAKLLAALDAAAPRVAGGTIPGALPALITVAGWVLAHPPPDHQTQAWTDFTVRVRRHLIQMLGQPQLREAALEALKQTGKAALPNLIAKLDDPDPEVRRAAMIALGAIGDASAAPALIEALDQEEGELVAVAAGALGKIGERAAFEPLCAQLAHPAALVRQTVVAAINSLGHPRHTERMLVLAQADDPFVREAAVRSLGYFGDPAGLDAILRACTDEALTVRLAAFDSLSVYEEPQALDAARAGLADPAPVVRAAAARTLRFAPRAMAQDVLVQALRDQDMWVRVHACRSLAHFREPSAEPAIAALVADRMPPVRAAAATALSSYGSKTAVTQLQSLLGDAEPEVVMEAIHGLAATHHPAAVPILFDLAVHAAGESQRQAISALGKHGSPEAVASLQRLVETDLHPELALGALLQTRLPAAVTIIVGALQRMEHRKAAIEAASQLGEAALAGMAGLLRQPDCALETRLAIIEVLQRIHSAPATELVIRLLHDPAASVRLAAVHALSDVGSLSAHEALTAIARTDPDAHVRHRALRAAQRLR